MSSKILEALSKLDATNDNHWTQDGLPRLDTIRILAGDPALTREAVTAANPNFNRSNAGAGAQGGAATPAQATPGNAPQAGAQAANGADSQPPATEFPNLNPAPVAEDIPDADDLHSKIQEAMLQISDAQSKVMLAKQELSDAQNSLAELEKQLKETPEGSENAVQGYLRAQRRNLEIRAAKKELILQSGLDMKLLAEDLKSPLDAALRRRAGTRR